MPIEKSYMLNEPSVGPVASQTTVAGSTLTKAEQDSGVEIKTIAGDVFTAPLVATSVSGPIFECDDNYQVVSVSAVAETVGGASAAVTVERLTGTTAPGSGVAQLSATIDLAANAHVVKNGTLKAGGSDTFAKGDRLGIVMSGTLTALVGHITVVVKRV